MSATTLQVSKQITKAEFNRASIVDPILDQLGATLHTLSGVPETRHRTTLEFLRDGELVWSHHATDVRITVEPAK